MELVEIGKVLETLGPWGVTAVLFWWARGLASTTYEVAKASVAAITETNGAILRLARAIEQRGFPIPAAETA